jgi:hypothetical protein
MTLLQNAFASDNYASEGAPLLTAGLSTARIESVEARKEKDTDNPTKDLIVKFVGTGEYEKKEFNWYIFHSWFDESNCTEDWHKDELVKRVNQVQHILSAFFDETKVKEKFATVKTADDAMALIKAGLSHDMAKKEADIKLVYNRKNRLDFPKGGKNKQGKFFVTNFLSTELTPRQININLNYDKLEPEAKPDQGVTDDEFTTTDTVDAGDTLYAQGTGEVEDQPPF